MTPCLFLLITLITGEASAAQKSDSAPRAFTTSVRQKPSLILHCVLVDESTAISLPDLAHPLIIGPGRHRLDFDFSSSTKRGPKFTHMRCLLEGNEDNWFTTTNGMSLICQVRDENKRVISEAKFDATGQSKGWRRSLARSRFTARSEPFYIPKEGRCLYISMRSGSRDATGVFAIQNLQVTLPGTPYPILWANSDLTIGENLHTPEGTPYHWSRRDPDSNIARLTQTSRGLALTLIDNDPKQNSRWVSRQAFDASIFAGRAVIISWKETYNVRGGSLHRASYLNVPPGEYIFRAVGMTSTGTPATASLELPIRITLPFWEQPWFPPLITACGVALLAITIIGNARRRTQRRLREFRFQNDLERDRARIARDMHDDLGTRISILNLNGALALRDLDQNPDNTRRLLSLMKSSSRQIVVAMDDLVWAVDPAYDNLEQFASHLTRMAEEIFRESPIRCRLDIPTMLKPRPLGADLRYQLALAVKEALHNVLRHAGQCEVNLSLKAEEKDLLIQVKDNGQGFNKQDTESPRHGLTNLKRRLEDLGGTCTITSASGEGTTIDFSCPLSFPRSKQASSITR